MAKLKDGSQVFGSLRVNGTFLDSSGDAGTSGQVLSSTGTGTNWVASGGGGGGVTFRAATFYGANNTQNISTAEVTVDIDQTLTTSGTGDFTVSAGGVVTVVNTGLYIITYTIATDVTTDNTRNTSYAYLRQDGAGEVTASRIYMYNRITASGEATGSKSLVINVTSANTTFEIRAGRLNGPETLIAIGSQSTITLHSVA